MSGITLINPATELALQTVEHSSLEQVDDAVADAVCAQRAWAALPPPAQMSPRFTVTGPKLAKK